MNKKELAALCMWIGILGIGVGMAAENGFPAFVVAMGIGAVVQAVILYLD